jgi:hypothetical protein
VPCPLCGAAQLGPKDIALIAVFVILLAIGCPFFCFFKRGCLWYTGRKELEARERVRVKEWELAHPEEAEAARQKAAEKAAEKARRSAKMPVNGEGAREGYLTGVKKGAGPAPPPPPPPPTAEELYPYGVPYGYSAPMPPQLAPQSSGSGRGAAAVAPVPQPPRPSQQQQQQQQYAAPPPPPPQQQQYVAPPQQQQQQQQWAGVPPPAAAPKKAGFFARMMTPGRGAGPRAPPPPAAAPAPARMQQTPIGHEDTYDYSDVRLPCAFAKHFANCAACASIRVFLCPSDIFSCLPPAQDDSQYTGSEYTESTYTGVTQGTSVPPPAAAGAGARQPTAQRVAPPPARAGR